MELTWLILPNTMFMFTSQKGNSKDGPSAGVAMATSIISAVTGIAVRRDVAMTGEITLAWSSVPIGG